jgi:hypothetical protein
MGEGDGAQVPAFARDARGRAVWSRALGAAIVARTAAGETLRGMCREPGMPQVRTVVKWLAGRPDFRAEMDAARVAAGGLFRGRRSTYCEATAEAIWARLAGGEPLVAIVADPAMPCWSTVHKWMNDRPEFGAAMASARAWIAERAFQTGWEICMGVTPATAQAAKVQLAHLRWHTGKLAPKTYGAPTQMTRDADPDAPMTVIVKRFSDVTAEEEAAADETERRCLGR